MLELKNVNFSYGEKTIVNDFSIKYYEGKITTLIGKNGSGKSTVLKLSSRLYSTYKGVIILKDKDIRRYSPKHTARLISVLPQTRDVADILVSDFVAHGRYPHLGYTRTLSQQDKSIIENAVEHCNIAHLTNRKLTELSGGERQRVYIAMVMAQNSEIVFLDEPITFLDINCQLEVLNLIKSFKEKGKTVVVVLHDIISALKISDYIGVIDDGNLAFYGSPTQLLKSDIIPKTFGINICSITDENQQEVFFVKEQQNI